MGGQPHNSLHILVGQNVRKIRKRRGFSQEELADMCGLHRTYIGGIERGERNLTVNTLQTLAKALDIPPGLLVSKEV